MPRAGLVERLRLATHPVERPPTGAPWNLDELDGLLSPGEPQPAAVLVGVVADAAEPSVLLTRRHDGLIVPIVDILAADAVLLGTTENLSYMAGLTKDFFDRCYYPVLEHKQGMPFALYIRAGFDGTGTKLAIKTIITGLRWNQIQDTLILKGDWQDAFVEQVEELAMTLAAGVEAGMY